MKVIKVIGLTLMGIILFFGIIWALAAHGLIFTRFWSPKFENVKRQVFEQTYSYNRGLIQEAYSQRRAWELAKPEHKDALASCFIHQFGADREKLPIDLQLFLGQIEGGAK